jgi:hypothetical protein
MVMTIFVLAPAGALWAMMDPPVLLRTFPRSRVGQFCSANAMLRSASIIVFGIPFGIGLDILGNHVGKDRAYLFLPIWQMLCFAGMLVSVVLLYRSWKRYGGDEHYVPPLPAGLIDEQAASPGDTAPPTPQPVAAARH